jgi:hypothetical protein
MKAPDDTWYPKGWGDSSFEFKLFFAYHGLMMVLFATGGYVPWLLQVAGAVVAASIIAGLVVRHRRRTTWRWPGATPKRILLAVANLALGGFFLMAAVPRFPPLDAHVVAWYLAGAGIVLFNALAALRILYLSQAAFDRDCVAAASGAAVDERLSDPLWARVVRVGFTTVFLAVWLGGVSFFFLHGRAMRDGATAPTGQHSEPLTDHGQTVYISRAEHRRLTFLEGCMTRGVPVVMVLGAVIHFLLGVKLVPNVPTLRSRRRPPDAT